MMDDGKSLQIMFWLLTFYRDVLGVYWVSKKRQAFERLVSK